MRFSLISALLPLFLGDVLAHANPFHHSHNVRDASVTQNVDESARRPPRPHHHRRYHTIVSVQQNCPGVSGIPSIEVTIEKHRGRQPKNNANTTSVVYVTSTKVVTSLVAPETFTRPISRPTRSRLSTTSSASPSSSASSSRQIVTRTRTATSYSDYPSTVWKTVWTTRTRGTPPNSLSTQWSHITPHTTVTASSSPRSTVTTIDEVLTIIETQNRVMTVSVSGSASVTVGTSTSSGSSSSTSSSSSASAPSVVLSKLLPHNPPWDTQRPHITNSAIAAIPTLVN